MTSSINRLIVAQMFRSLYFAGAINTLFLLAKGLSLSHIFTISSVFLLASMFFEIPTGVFADTYGRKNSMVVGAFVMALGWGLWIFCNTFIGFVGITIIFGLARAFWSGSDEALIYDELAAAGKKDQAQKVFSRYNGVQALTFAFSALVAGFLGRVHTVEVFNLLNQLTFFAALMGFLVTLTIKEQCHTPQGTAVSREQQTMLRQFSTGVRLLTASYKLRRVVLFSTFTLSLGLMDIYQVYFTRAAVPASWYGYVLSLSAVLISVTQWNAHRLETWFGVEKSMIITTLLPAILWTLMALTAHPLLAIVLFLANDVVGNTRSPIIADYQNRHIEGANRATVLSTISLFKSGYEVVMLPIIGLIAEYNVNNAFLTSAALIIIGFVFFRIRKEDVVVAE